MCECVEKVNTMLAESNTVLDRVSMLNMENGKCRESLVVATTRLHRERGRTKVKKVLPSFCPFCGEKIKTTSDDGDA